MFQLVNFRDKKGISVVIGYVLLISIGIALSVIVYQWLRFYVDVPDEKACPEGVNLIIKDYVCQARTLNLTLKNKGLRTVDGFIVRVNDREDADLGRYNFPEQIEEIVPGNETNIKYSFDDIVGSGITLSRLSFVEVQPFIYDNGERLFCDALAKQELNC